MSPVSFLLFLLFMVSSPGVWSFEAREDRQSVFAQTPCPAFLTFTNAAYMAGVTVELPCNCKPEQIQTVIWFFRKHTSSAKNTHAITDVEGNRVLDTSGLLVSRDLRSRFSIRLFSLLIFHSGTDDSGFYICGSKKNDFFTGYDLDIQEGTFIEYSPRSFPNRAGERAATQTRTFEPLYRVFTGFQNWSVCDRCGVRGEQIRAGICYIQSRFLHVRYRRLNQTVTSCGSGAVPPVFSELIKIPAKLQVQQCQVPCPSEEPPSSSLLELLDFLGLRSAGSILEAMQVYYVTQLANQLLIVGCPGSSPTLAVAWDRGLEPIYRFGDGGVTSSRIFINVGNHLVFQPTKIQDSGSYHCWLQGRRVAEIRLVVIPSLGPPRSVFSHPDLPETLEKLMSAYVAMVAVFCVFERPHLLVGLNAGCQDERDIPEEEDALQPGCHATLTL